MNNEALRHELHGQGIKNTPKKATLLGVLKESAMPITATDLHLICKKTISLDVATVYRTLQQFKEKGMVREFLGNDGIIQYEYIGEQAKAHPHFQCEKCHGVVCLGELSFEDALYFSNMAKNHQIRSINVTLSGVCESCLSH